MKSQVIRIVGFAAVLVGSAWAQLAHPVVADIPFDFTVGKTTLAAGEYQVRTQQPGVLRIATADGKHTALILSTPKISRKPPAESTLMFNRYGDRYFLSQVLTAGSQTGVELRKTSAEVEIAKRTNDRQDTAIVARQR